MGGSRWLGVGQLHQHQKTVAALDQGAHRTGVAFSLDQVSFPMAGELPVLDLGRAQVDAEHAADLPAAVLALAARQALVVRVAQAGDQVTAKLAHGLGVDAVVDGFVRHAVVMPLRVQARERQGDLLGRPTQAQEVLDGAERDRVDVQFTQGTCLHATVAAGLLREGARVVAGSSAVSLELPAEGAGAAMEHARHGKQAVALLLEAGQCDAVFGLELGMGWGAGQHGWTLQGRALRFRFESALLRYGRQPKK